MEIGESPAYKGQTIGVIKCLGEVEALLVVGNPFLELSAVGVSPGQITGDSHGRKPGEAKPLPAQIAFKQPQAFLKTVLGLSIVARPDAGRADVEIPRHLESSISNRLGDGLGALAERERFRRMTSILEAMAQRDGQLPESPLIAKRPRQRLGLAEMAEADLEVAERMESEPQVEAKITGLLQRLTGL